MGAGRTPAAPGTAGSLVGLLLFLVLKGLPALIYGLLGLTLFLLGVYVAERFERVTGRRDPPEVVIDEICGMLLTLAFLPPAPFLLLAGFLFFRLFDILKPFPVRWVERLPGGWGVMADDAVAAVYAHLALRGLGWVIG